MKFGSNFFAGMAIGLGTAAAGAGAYYGFKKWEGKGKKQDEEKNAELLAVEKKLVLRKLADGIRNALSTKKSGELNDALVDAHRFRNKDSAVHALMREADMHLDTLLSKYKQENFPEAIVSARKGIIHVHNEIIDILNGNDKGKGGYILENEYSDVNSIEGGKLHY